MRKELRQVQAEASGAVTVNAGANNFSATYQNLHLDQIKMTLAVVAYAALQRITEHTCFMASPGHVEEPVTAP
jgi:hypothetical protein